jgi:hypothetical protein
LWNLAKDIAENGLNPSEMPIVCVDENENYTVKDGNRRIAALIAISKPNQIPSPDKAYIKRFKKLKAVATDKVGLTRLRKISCIVFEDDEEADRWVRLNHTGENKGVGTVQWNGLMVERFKAQRDRPSMQLQAYNFVERHAADDLRQQLDNFPISTLGRLLSNPDFRESLGFVLKDGTLKYEIPKEDALKNLTKVVEDLAAKKIQVSDVFSTEDMKVYAADLKAQGFLRKTNKLSVPEAVEEEKDQSEIPPKTAKPHRKEKLSTSRRTRLIPADHSITIADTRENNIYRELKSLNVDKFPNAVAVLFRVFFELSLNRCIVERKVANIRIESELVNKIKRVHDHFIANGIMKKEEMQSIMLLCNETGNQPIPMTRQFNGYVHNSAFNPVPGDLKILWDNLQLFVSKLWE